FFFFFFQAEDGIRDYKVTGVQTCALPICPTRPAAPVRPAVPRGSLPAPHDRRGGFGPHYCPAHHPGAWGRSDCRERGRWRRRVRSEERRVGKEGGVWWWGMRVK